jgi:undecaprenyl-diphosphatase
MLENINLLWFSMINSNAGLHGWRLELALFCAEWLILLVPIGLTGLWMSGAGAQREAAVKAAAATGVALCINAVIGLLWYHARPFVAGVGHNFMHHGADSSFPSDHGTIMFTVALVLAASQVPAAKRFGHSLLPLAFVVAWARVFLGVHWPLDMLGAMGVAVGVTLLFQARLLDTVCALLTSSLGTLYRRLLARPIARGWLRP